MAKARVSINPMYKGGAGGYSFYVRGGEQVVRQRKNNSNYGDSASRTRAQMIRRIMWGNLVNVYKAIKSWQQKAYDTKAIGQTDYNLFMKLNIPMASVGVTKAACEQGFGVFENYQVSKGSLPPVNYQLSAQNDDIITNIVYTSAILATTTVGEFASEIIAKNPQFQAGDNIAFIFFRNHQYIGAEWPYAYSVYTEVTLNPADTSILMDIPEIGQRLIEGPDNVLHVDIDAPTPGGEPEVEGVAIIHTRKVSGQLFVSSQSILMESDQFIQRYSGEEWYNTCIDSYGIDTEVPLDPNFNQGIITRVTANDAALQNAAVLSGSQVIRVYGNKLYGNGYSFMHDCVDYTPLSSTDEYDEYILTDSGSYIIYIDGQIYMSFSVNGISFPTELAGGLFCYQIPGTTTSSGAINQQSINSQCLNYAHKVSNDYPAFYLMVRVKAGEEVSADDFEFEQCTKTNFIFSESEHTAHLFIQPNDADGVCYVKFADFILLVTNYD